MTSMLAVRAHPGVGGLVVEDVPVPEPGPGDVLIKVASAGVAPGILRLLELGFFKHLPTTIGIRRLARSRRSGQRSPASPSAIESACTRC